MPLNPNETGKIRVFTIRPFAGRNSDMDAMSIRDNEASGGSNWVARLGRIVRRPGFSRIGTRLTLGVSTQANFAQLFNSDIVVAHHDSATLRRSLRLLTRGGLCQISSDVLNDGNLRYDSGVVSLSTGSRIVQGTGTAWLTRNIHPGSSMTQGTQTLEVRSITSDTSMEIAALPTTGGSSLSYGLARYKMNRYPGVASEYVGPDFAEFMAVRGTSVLSGVTIQNSGVGTFVPGAQITTLTPGERWVGVGQDLYDYFGSFARLQGWLHFANDVASGAEMNGVLTAVERRAYKFMGRETVSGSRRLYFHERYRGTSGAGSAGVYVNQGWTTLFDAVSTSTEHVLVEIANAIGTVSINQGATTVNGSGTGFVQSNLLAGDEIGISAAHYRITSVASDTQATIAPAFDQDTVSGSNYNLRFRRTVGAVSSSMNSTLNIDGHGAPFDKRGNSLLFPASDPNVTDAGSPYAGGKRIRQKPGDFQPNYNRFRGVIYVLMSI